MNSDQAIEIKLKLFATKNEKPGWALIYYSL